MSGKASAREPEGTRVVLEVFPGSAQPSPLPLPAPLTTLIGREEDAAGVAALLTDPEVRAVTLLGPGGIGKTRLSLRIAASLESAFANGVAFVDLSAIRGPDLVIPAIGSALGFRLDHSQSPLEALQTMVRPFEILLVLDNLEQIVDAGPDLAALIRACPDLTLLITSRTRLRISAEHVVPVAPLAVPLDADVEQIADIAAIRLFVQRARAVDSSFQLTSANAPAVAAIVQRLEGLPLAIELAAARISVFPPDELLARMGQRLPQLTAGPRDDPPRHHTMRDSIAWSYDLLTPDEQAVFRALSVFSGGATIPALEAVCGDDALEFAESLANQSLVRFVKPASDASSVEPVHLTMLETVREFAAEQLLASGDQKPRQRHEAWFLALATSAARMFYGDEAGDWRSLIEPELANLRAALASAVESGDADMALSLASAMEWAAFVARGLWDPVGIAAALAREQERWVERALVMPGGSPTARARALVSAAWATLVHDRPRSIALSDEALAIAREHDDIFAMANASAVRGLAALHEGDAALARPYLTDALSGFRELNQPGRGAWVLCELAVTETRKAVDEGGDADSLARAAAYYEEALALFEAIGQERGISRASHGLAYIVYKQRHLPEALERVRAILTRDWAQHAPVTHYIEDIADIAGRIGRPDVAVRLYGFAEAQRERIRRPIHGLYQQEYESEVAISRQALSESAFASGWAAGRELTLEEAVAEALSDFDQKPNPRAGGIVLTSRESEVLHLLVAGHTDKEIADILFISPRTAEGHVRGLCRKLGARNRATAITTALASGLVEPQPTTQWSTPAPD